MESRRFEIIVIGGGHAGAEAAWACANLLAGQAGCSGKTGSVGLVTLRADTIGTMSCNPAIGGLAKGQLVREIDALGGLMGLAADAAGINFKVLNTSKGSAVHGPRAQCDKHAYARAVRALVVSRDEIEVIEGAVEEIVVESGVDGDHARGVVVSVGGEAVRLDAGAVVLTTGTFMRGLMHTGEQQTPGGRHGEAATSGISKWLADAGFELGRLKTGTPPRLKQASIDWDSLEAHWGDDPAVPFSDLSDLEAGDGWRAGELVLDRFPLIEQCPTRLTRTTPATHEVIRANMHRSPIWTGQIESAGPRYCPSIEDKVARFADRESHQVFMEPESYETDTIYCNGIATSLPADVQEQIVRAMPGCERAEIVRHGYTVEYDMVRPHQITAGAMTKRIAGLFLAGQINGTSGYEEAAAQGLVAGVNAVRFARGEPEWVCGRDEGYIGVLMDDLVTKTPVEPYRMFTSRAEHRVMLRSGNSADRLTPIGERLGLLGGTALGRQRLDVFRERTAQLDLVRSAVAGVRVEGVPLSAVARRTDFTVDDLRGAVGDVAGLDGVWRTVWAAVHAELRYAPYVARAQSEIGRQSEQERRRLPASIDWERVESLRTEAKTALTRFRPATFGQAARLEGITPADLTLMAVVVKRHAGGHDAVAMAGA